MVCSKCGTENISGVKFCSYCGNEMANNVNAVNEVTQINVQSKDNVINLQQLNDKKQKVSENKIGVLEMIKKFDKKKLIIVLAALIIIIILLVVLLGGNRKSYEELYDTNSFFLSDADGNYALFNESGKRLTNFEFDGSSTFFNGSAFVRNKDGESALINEKGKFLIKYDKYTTILRNGPLYSAIDSKYTINLLDSKGKKIGTLDKADVLELSNASLIAIIKYEKDYKVINYEGETILKIKRAAEEKEMPSISSNGKYTSIYYNDKTYIVDSIEGKEITSFDSKSKYCIEEVNVDNENLYILESCGSKSSEENGFKVLNKKKILLEKDKDACSSLYFEGENVICDSKDGDVILDKDGKSILNVDDDVAYLDSKNYAKNTKDSLGVEFYSNGKLKKTVKCLKLIKEGYNDSGIYLLGTTYNKDCDTKYGTYQYFDKNGKPLTSDKYTSATNFDENGLGIVSVTQGEYYLINKKGDKVSSTYDRIGYAVGKYYVATIDSNIKVIIDSKGKEGVKAKYIDISNVDEDKYYAILEHSNDTYSLYNLNKKKEVVKLDSKPSLSKHYFRTSNDGKKQYYSYKNGKMFHEV